MHSALIALGAALAGEPFQDGEFRALVLDAESALDRGDLDLTLEVIGQIEARVPDMVFSPEPRIWADLMVVVAIASHAQGEAWEGPLAAALRIRPAIDRVVGPGHPLYDWEPPATVPGSAPPKRHPESRFYVDGRLSDEVPPDSGWYLFQRTDGRFWDTHWVKDAPAVLAWWSEPVPQQPRIRYWAAGGLHAGVARVENRPIDRSEWFVDDPGGTTFSRFHDVGSFDLPSWGPHGQLRATFFSPLGVSIRGSSLWNTSPSTYRDLRFSGIYEGRRAVVGLGLSFADALQVRYREAGGAGSEERRVDRVDWTSALERMYHLEFGYRVGGRTIQAEGTAILAARSTASYGLLADFWVVLGEQSWARGVRPRIGGMTTITHVRFEQSETDRRFAAVTGRTVFMFGFVIGEYR